MWHAARPEKGGQTLIRLVVSGGLAAVSSGMAPGGPVERRFAWMCRLLAVLIAAHFTLAYAAGTTSYVDLAAYVAGQARLPFQYRALTGWVLRGVLELAGLPMRDAAPVLMGLVFASTLAIFASARVVAARLVGPGVLAWTGALGFAVPLYVMFAAPAYDYRFSYPYDLPSLALFFAALAAFVTERLVLCVVLFVVAALTRETCLMLIPVVLLWPAPSRRARLVVAGCLSVVWVACWGLVHALYRGNVQESAFMHQLAMPGGMVIELGNNWQDLRDPGSWPALLSVFAWAWLPLALYWRRIDHAGVRRVIVLMTPSWYLLMFTVGRLREVRVFAELTVVYWCAIMLVLLRSHDVWLAAMGDRPAGGRDPGERLDAG